VVGGETWCGSPRTCAVLGQARGLLTARHTDISADWGRTEGEAEDAKRPDGEEAQRWRGSCGGRGGSGATPSGDDGGGAASCDGCAGQRRGSGCGAAAPPCTTQGAPRLDAHPQAYSRRASLLNPPSRPQVALYDLEVRAEGAELAVAAAAAGRHGTTPALETLRCELYWKLRHSLERHCRAETPPVELCPLAFERWQFNCVLQRHQAGTARSHPSANTHPVISGLT